MRLGLKLDLLRGLEIEVEILRPRRWHVFVSGIGKGKKVGLLFAGGRVEFKRFGRWRNKG